MKKIIGFLTLASIFFVMGCKGQTQKIVKPELVAKFSLGTNDFFEKDLEYVKSVLNNEMYAIQTYSFLPSAIHLFKDQIIIYDKMSCNVIIHNFTTGQNQSIKKINSILKQFKVKDKQNIELVDISNNRLLFYNTLYKECLLINLSEENLECKIHVENPIAIDLNKDLKIYGYRKNYILTSDCSTSLIGINKRLPINKNFSFIKFNENLFYQNLDENKIQTIKLTDSTSIFSEIALFELGLGSDYCLIHVDAQYYILSSSIEIGLGEFLFISKKTLKIEKSIRVDSSILGNDLIDFYNAISDAPSPDVDDSNSYLRMTSYENKYFIFFQSKGNLLLYSFDI